MALACVAPPDADDDVELAAALACDLDASFEALVIAYRNRIVSFVARMLRDDARAEDVAQDVFVRAYRALQSYDAPRRRALRLRPWLYAIAHNLTRNAVRDAPPSGEALERSDGSARPLPGDARAWPEAVVERHETFAVLERAIATLSPRLRPAFVMRYLQDASYDEIADVLGQPVGTVKASAHRGLLAIRARMENDHD